MVPVILQVVGFVFLIWRVVKLVREIRIGEHVMDELLRVAEPNIVASKLPRCRIGCKGVIRVIVRKVA